MRLTTIIFLVQSEEQMRLMKKSQNIASIFGDNDEKVYKFIGFI